MLYAITAEAIDQNSPPDVILQFIEGLLIPSLQMLGQWEASGKIKGGVWAGYRGGTMIMDAASHDEVSQLLLSLPFWGFHRWTVTPLVTWATELKEATTMAGNLRKMMGK